jgi:hypothetical protein
MWSSRSSRRHAKRDPLAKLIMTGVYDTHFALSAKEFVLIKASCHCTVS